MSVINNKHIQTATLKDVLNSLDDLVEEGYFRIANDHTVAYANSAFVTMFEFTSPDDLHNTAFEELCAEDHMPVFVKNKVKTEGYLINQRILCKQKSGGNFWASVSGKKIQSDTGCTFAGVIHDISERIEAEEALKQREMQFEKLTMELDRFIYSASHEIRSPVSTLSGVINIMKHDLCGEQAQQYIGFLQAGIEKLEQIIAQLTGHVKNYRNPVEDRYIDFDIMLKDILEEFHRGHPMFSKACLSLEINGSSVFHCDPERLRMILHNIIKNSLDYMDDRKSMKVVSVSVNRKFEKAVIEVFDNGVGIPTTHVGRVFDMFYRASNHTKGSGIGLYTVREAVTKLGGTIKLFSEFGVGTSVIIELPNSKKGKLVNRKKLLRIPGHHPFSP